MTLPATLVIAGLHQPLVFCTIVTGLRVLEDAAISNPNAAAVEELKRELVEAKKLNNPEKAEGNRAMGLQSAIADLERYQQPNFFSKKGTERDHLKEYVEDLDRQIALTLPHTQIKVLESK